MKEPVDLSSLLELRRLQSPGKPDRVGRIVSTFLDETGARLAALRLAAESGDSTLLERGAHALKGISGTVGANEMLYLSVRLETVARDGHTDGAADLVTELESALSRARPILDRLRSVDPIG